MSSADLPEWAQARARDKKFESDAERFSEFCLCSFDEARSVIDLCTDYARDEKQYWENINEAIGIYQSDKRQAAEGDTLPIIQQAFEAKQ